MIIKKRSNFYPNGEIIDYRLPQTFQKTQTKSACGNCYLFSNRRNYCGKHNAPAVKENYICHLWRQRHFLRWILLSLLCFTSLRLERSNSTHSKSMSLAIVGFTIMLKLQKRKNVSYSQIICTMNMTANKS